MKEVRYDYIDTLRLFSILFIVISHFDGECFACLTGISMMQMHLGKEGKLGLLAYGWTGKYALAILCVISGFLAAMRFGEGGGCDVGSFLVTRYFRMMLPVMVSNFFFGVLLKVREEPLDVASWLKGSFVPGFPLPNRNLWCIGSFLVGNLLVCLVYYLQQKGIPLVGLYGLLLVLLAALQDVWLFAIVAGGLCLEVARWLKERRLAGNWWMCGILPLVWLLPRGEESTAVYYRDIGAAVLIMTAFYCLPVLQRAFACPFLKPLKKCCYSLFVVHGMTLFAVEPAWRFVQEMGISSGAGIYICLFFILFSIDLLAAYVVYYLSEVKLYHAIVKRFLPDG